MNNLLIQQVEIILHLTCSLYKSISVLLKQKILILNVFT